MIQQKKATDRALYQRALKAYQNGDETMKPVIEWYRLGKKPKPKGTTHHRKAREVLVELKKTHTTHDLTGKFDTYYSLIQRLINGKFNHVPEWKAKQIATHEVEPAENPGDAYRQARATLLEQYTNGATYDALATKYGLGVNQVRRCIRDYYSTPHKQIIKAVMI